jgi:hypothetical protein
LSLGSADSVFLLSRYDLAFSTNAIIAKWPPVPHTSSMRALAATAINPAASGTSTYGSTRLCAAGWEPQANGTTDLVILGTDEKLSLTWTFRVIGFGAEAGLPVAIVPVDQGNGVLSWTVGYTLRIGAHLAYQVHLFQDSNGKEIYKGFYAPAGVDATLSSIAVSSSPTPPFTLIFAAGTAAVGADGHTKVAVAEFDNTEQSGQGHLWDVPNANDGKAYEAVAVAPGIQPAPQSGSFLTVTASVTPNTDTPSNRDYFVAAFNVFAPPIHQGTVRWVYTYDNPHMHGDDVPMAIAAMGGVSDAGGNEHQLTWVTGQSQATTGDADCLTVMLDSVNGGIPAVDWIARFDRGYHGSDAGIALGLDPTITAPLHSPFIYVLARAQTPDGAGHNYMDYVELSYTVDPDTGQEDKQGRWVNPILYPTDPTHLPPDCFFGYNHAGPNNPPAPPDGDSLPTALSVHNFTDPNTGIQTWYMLRTGKAMYNASGNDIATTVEEDRDHP